MNIVITGCEGMLGKAVRRRAAQRRHTICPMTERIQNLTGFDLECETVLINCAGLVKQRDLPPSAFYFNNSYAPHRLAEICDAQEVRMIHVSTDCVFPPADYEHGPFGESRRPHPTDVYALSKLAGEITRAPHLTVRTSFVGFGERGLIHDILTKPSVVASPHLKWSGHTVDTVADVLVTLAERPEIHGLLHIPGEFQTRLDLVRRLVEWLGVDTIIIESDSFHADRHLISDRWKGLGLPELPDFQTQLERMRRP